MKAILLIKPVLYLATLIGTMIVVLWVEKIKPSDFGFYKDIFKKEEVIQKSRSYPLSAYKVSLTDEDMEIGKIAWNYFKNNFHPETGFVNSVDKYPSTTLWDLTSSLHGTVSAYEIGLIDYAEMKTRVDKCLQSMSTMPLYKDMLPNKVYNTQTMQMVDYANNITPIGVGWSSMDIGRFFSFCKRVIIHYPEFNKQVRDLIGKWKVSFILNDATLHGIGFSFKDKSENLVQEGKLGYEEYAAKGYEALGYDVSEALQYSDFIRFVSIYGEDIAVDTREVKYNPAYNYILSEPYILDGIEYGWDVTSRELAYRVYKVQKKRYENTKIPTAVSESHIDTIPYFVYNSIYANGKKWSCFSESGEPADEFKTFSTSAAFGWYTLYNDDYTKVLYQEFLKLANKDLGWYSGRYEKTKKINKSITANTNGFILECLRYKLNGPLIKLN